MTPDNYFPIPTSPVVVTRTWPIGTTKYGYGSTINEAILDSDCVEMTEAFGQPSLVVYQATDKIVKRGRFEYRVYDRS